MTGVLRMFLDPKNFKEAFAEFGVEMPYSTFVIRLAKDYAIARDEFDLDEFIAGLWFEQNPDGDEVMPSQIVQEFVAVLFEDVRVCVDKIDAAA